MQLAFLAYFYITEIKSEVNFTFSILHNRIHFSVFGQTTYVYKYKQPFKLVTLK